MPNHPLEVPLFVTNFRDIKDLGNLGRFCDVALLDTGAFNDPNKRAKLYAGDNKTIRLSNGKASPTGAAVGVDVKFFVKSPPGAPKVDYVIAGVISSGSGFVPTTKGGTTTPANFTIGEMKDNAITLINNHTQGRAYFEILIAIQNPEGKVGIIDPGVENSEEA